MELKFAKDNFDIDKAVKEMLDRKDHIISITHREDFDGIGSAAIIKHYFNIPDSNLMFGDYKSSTINAITEKIKAMNLSKMFVIITDLGLDEPLIPAYQSLISYLKDKDSYVIWLDHHNWSNETVEKVAKMCDFAVVGDNDKFCGAELTFRELIKGRFDEGFGEKIAAFTHKTDFNLPNLEDFLLNIIKYITYSNYHGSDNALVELVNFVSEEDFNNEKINETAQLYNKEESENLEKLKSMVFDYSINEDYKIGIGFGGNINSTKACLIVSDLTNSDISIFVNVPMAKISIRGKGKLDCIKLANKMGGNGHFNAAGAPLTESIELSDREKIKAEADKMAAMAKEVYS